MIINVYQRRLRECDILAKTQNLISKKQDDEKTHNTTISSRC